MGYTYSELEELADKYKFRAPEAQVATRKTFLLADQRLEYALRILGASHWWLGWRGALMGKAILTTDEAIGTACVGFNRTTSKMDYYFNVWFAASLSAGDIAFVIAHECLHLILGHVRQIDIFKIKYPGVWNIVTDAFINELLRRELKWSSGMRADEKQDWTLQNGIYWKNLPKAVRERYPADAGVPGEVNIEHTCIELYNAMLEDMESKGIDPNEFEHAIEQKHFGAEKRRKQKIDREEESSDKIVRKKVYVEPGDVVFVKTQDRYGIAEKFRRIADQEGEAEIFYADDILQPEWIWLSRAIGITGRIGKKSFAMSRKIVETYAKMKAAGMRPMTWEPFAKALGIPEIAELDEIDRLIKERDLKDEAEIEAAYDDLNAKLARDVAQQRDLDAHHDLEQEVAAANDPALVGSLEPATSTPAGQEEEEEQPPPAPPPTGMAPMGAVVPPVPTPIPDAPTPGRTPLWPKISDFQRITAQKGPVPFKPSVKDFQRQVAIMAARTMEDFTFGPMELFKDEKALGAMVGWLLRLQAKR